MDSIQYCVTSTEWDLHMTNPQIQEILTYYEDVPVCWWNAYLFALSPH